MIVLSNVMMMTPAVIFFTMLLPNHLVPVFGEHARFLFGGPGALLLCCIQSNYWASCLLSPGYTTKATSQRFDGFETGTADCAKWSARPSLAAALA